MLTLCLGFHLFKIELFCSLLNVHTVTFAQFKANLLEKKKEIKSYCPQTFEKRHIYGHCQQATT